MSNTTYNGWTNYQTWVINLWLTNDSSSDEYLREQAHECLDLHDGDKDGAVQALANAIEAQHEELSPTGSIDGPFADLLNHALGMVDWREIAQHVIDDEYDSWRENNLEEIATDETRAYGPHA